jgi:hypothetical protein
MEVVAVHEGTGWTVQLDGTDPSFVERIPALDSMLSTWHFR